MRGHEILTFLHQEPEILAFQDFLDPETGQLEILIFSYDLQHVVTLNQSMALSVLSHKMANYLWGGG